MHMVLLAALLLLGGCQGAPVLPTIPEIRDAGTILDLRTGQAINPPELADRLSRAPRVIVGEQHDNPEHHARQLWLLQMMARHRPQGSLLLEMLAPDQQPRIEDVRKHVKVQGLPGDLPDALAWQSGWDWALYEPIVRFALVQPYPLLAANLNASEIRDIYTHAPVLSGIHSNAASVRSELLVQIRESHCGLLPDSQVPAMLVVQQQRDRRMAERLLSAATPSVFFAGAFHARKDVGVPVHLKDLGQSDGTVVLMLAQKGAQVAYGAADYVWYTAPMPDQDYCAQLHK